MTGTDWLETWSGFAARARAETGFAAARDTAHSLVFDLAQGLRNREGMPTALVRDLLDRAGRALDALLARTPDDPATLRLRGVAYGEFATTFATLGGIAGGGLLLFFGGARLSNTQAFKRIALTDTQESKEGYTVNASASALVGKKGTAYTVLRPSGKVMIDNQLYDAFTRGEFIEKGETIEVVSSEGVTLKVKKS